MAPALASIDLLLLCLVALSVALLDTPVPRAWALAAVALLTVQTFALRAMNLEQLEPGEPPSQAVVHTFAEDQLPEEWSNFAGINAQYYAGK